MEIPADLRYLKSHEWAKVEGNRVTIGVTEYAVEALNRDIVFVELPAVESQVKQGESFGVIEAVKAVYDLYSPITGEVVEINKAAANDAGIVGQSPFGEGWLIRIEMVDPSELDKLLDAKQYEELIEREQEQH